MSLSEQIRRGWARTAEGYTEEIEGLSAAAWVIRLKDGYGVAIPNEAHKMIEENFSAVILKNEHISISGEEREALVLLCEKDAGSEQPFSALCAEFVNPGKEVPPGGKSKKSRSFGGVSGRSSWEIRM